MTKDFKSAIYLFVFSGIWVLQFFITDIKNIKIILPGFLFLFLIIMYFVLIQKTKHSILLFLPIFFTLAYSFFNKNIIYSVFPTTVLLSNICLLKKEAAARNNKTTKVKHKEAKSKHQKIYLYMVFSVLSAIIVYIILIVKNGFSYRIFYSNILKDGNHNLVLLFLLIDLFLFIIGLNKKSLSVFLEKYSFYTYKGCNFLRVAEMIFLILQLFYAFMSLEVDCILITSWIAYYLFIIFYCGFYLEYPVGIICQKH